MTPLSRKWHHFGGKATAQTLTVSEMNSVMFPLTPCDTDFKKHSLQFTASESRSHSSSRSSWAVRTCQGKFDVTQSKSFHPLPPRSPPSCCKERVTEDWQLRVTVCECLGPVSESCCERMKVSSASPPRNRSPLANVRERRTAPACCERCYARRTKPLSSAPC